MEHPRNYVIDFDSTFTKVEALDLLGEISLRNHPEKEKSLHEINKITDEGMAGKIPFRQSLEARIKLLKAHKNHLVPLIDNLKERVSKSFRRNKDFLHSHADHIFIISNGFKDFDTFFSGMVELPSGKKQKVFICQNESSKFTIMLPEDY